jgi:hypothetical protein
MGVTNLPQAKRFAISEQREKVTCMFPACNYQDISDSSIKKGLNGIIDHRLIVDREKMLIGYPREWIKAGPQSASKDNPFHVPSLRLLTFP